MLLTLAGVDGDCLVGQPYLFQEEGNFLRDWVSDEIKADHEGSVGDGGQSAVLSHPEPDLARLQEFQRVVASVLVQVEAFFLRCVERGQEDGSIGRRHRAADLAGTLLASVSWHVPARKRSCSKG